MGGGDPALLSAFRMGPAASAGGLFDIDSLLSRKSQKDIKMSSCTATLDQYFEVYNFTYHFLLIEYNLYCISFRYHTVCVR